MTKLFIFGKHNIGDGIVVSKVEKDINLPSEYLGERVDLSRIKPEDGNIVVVINRNIFTMDLGKILAYINKDLTTPLIVLKRIRTFGGLTFGKNYTISDIFTNKIYIFAGIFYLPKDSLKPTMSQVFRAFDKNKLRTFCL